jgi:hypothetical protein
MSGMNAAGESEEMIALQLRDSGAEVRVELLNLISPEGADGRWDSWRRVSITARVLGAVDDPTYRTSFGADIRDVLMLGHFENFRDDLRTYLDLGAAIAVVLGGERAAEVRLELPALHELGSTDAIVEVAATNGPRLSFLLSLKSPELRAVLQSVERAVAAFTDRGR